MSTAIGSQKKRKQINLYQAEFRPPQILLPTQSLLLGVVVFTVGLLLLYVWDSWKLVQYRQETQRMEDQANRMAQLLETAPPDHQVDPRVEAEAIALEGRVRALQLAQEAIASGALGNPAGYSAQFLGLSRTTVPGVWLTRIEVTGQGREINLAGRTLQGEGPARLIAALASQPQFVGLSYAAMDVHPPTEGKPGQADGNDEPAKRLDFLEFSMSARLPESKGPNNGQEAAQVGGAS